MPDVTPFQKLQSWIPPWSGTLACCLLAGLLFQGVFWLAYRQIDDNLYANRDDAIITASHARNWVEYGSIGVNPSGERVEGFSSPLQLLLFSGAYALTHVSYGRYFLIVTYLSAIAMGILLFFLCLPHRVLGLVLTALAAIALALDSSFLEWHASGMENALTHAFFLLAVVLLVHMYAIQRIRYAYVLPVFAASIARIESIYHIAPLLAVFAVCWLVAYRQFRGLGFAGLTLAVWAVFFAIRWHYFGALFPNTAAAQAISVGDRAGLLLAGDAPYWKQSLALSAKSFSWHHGWILLPVCLCLPFMQFNRKAALAALLLLSLAVTGLFSPFLFGEARLDATRLSTQVALAVVALAVLAAAHTRRPTYRYFTVPVTVASAATILLWSYAALDHRPYYLWFSENVFAQFRHELVTLREKHDIPRPAVANPDLGLMSWYKDCNIVDLGYLGNPVLTQLDAFHDEGKRDIANYFFDIAAPDLIELHGVWSERHAHLFKDPRFQERYVAADAHIDAFLQKRFTRSPSFRGEYGAYVRAGYWVRRDIIAGSDSRERRFVEDLRAAISLERIDRELKGCEAEHLTADQAQYVVRTAYRFLPEFVAAGLYPDLVSLLETHETRLGYSTALIRGRTDPDWHDALFRYVRAYAPVRVRDRMERDYEETFAAAGDMQRKAGNRIAPGLWLTGCRLTPAEGKWGKLQLLFECERPMDKDWRLFVHGLVPDDRRALAPADAKKSGFLNWDIGFPDPPTTDWNQNPHVVLTLYVPDYAAATSVTAGFYRPGEGSLGRAVTIPVPAP